MRKAFITTGVGLARTVGIALSVAAGSMSLAYAATDLRFLPPKLDYKSSCINPATHGVSLDRDWTQWTGDAVTTPPNDLFELAGEYLVGSERVQQSIPTSLKILDYLSTHKLFAQARIDRQVGRATIMTAEDTTALKLGESKLLGALDGGVARAAFDLGHIYDSKGPSQLRDAAKAKHYFQIAAAAGDVDAELDYAHLLSTDPSVTADTKTVAISNAMLGMIQHISNGDCKYMETVGFLYLNGDMVPQNYDIAAEWFEQYAETGNAHIQERVGRLLSSRLVTDVDYDKAMDFLEQAAAQGRPFAALTVGKAYATGVGRPRDPVAAAKFLIIAADGNLHEANFWLARVYQGEFGGTPQPELAKQRFEMALASGPVDPDVEAQYGEFLSEAVPGVSDPEKALDLLEGAAQNGSGRAAVIVARTYLERAKADSSLYKKAEEYYRLGVELGKPEAARALAKMYACGQGVPLSIAKANEWSARAYSLGSASALYDAGVAALVSTDPVEQAKGRTLLKQSALRGYPAAIGYAIAHYESGRDGVAQDLEAAQRLQKFVDASDDEAFRLEAQLETIKARIHLAQGDAEIAAQYQVLDGLVASGIPAANMVKAELLTDSGKGTPAELRDLYRVAAEGGDPRAMREYAMILLADPTSDLTQGRQWLDRAAAAGDIKAKIAEIDTTSPDATQLLETAVQSYEICTVDEMVTIARAFAGVVDPAATDQAKFWLNSASTVVGNDADDLFKIADAYRDGVAGPQAIPSAEDFFVRSANLGRQTALRDVADGHLLGLWKDSSPDKAKGLLIKLFDGGDMLAGAKLIDAVADKQVSASADELEHVLKGLPTVGRPGETYLKLARLDSSGAFGGVHPDLQVEWLQIAADSGNPNAMIRLYRVYAAGVGVPVSPQTAVGWLLKAADAGDSRAAVELAAAYDVGFGVPADPTQAAYWRAKIVPKQE